MFMCDKLILRYICALYFIELTVKNFWHKYEKRRDSPNFRNTPLSMFLFMGYRKRASVNYSTILWLIILGRDYMQTTLDAMSGSDDF